MSVNIFSTTGAKLKVEFGGYSLAGVKAQNEDAFAAYQPDSGKLRYVKGVVACIADGASCSKSAQRASQLSVSHFIDDYYSTPDTWSVKQSAAKVLTALNAWLFHHGQQSSSHHAQRGNEMVTTFSAVVIKSNTAHIFHAGDSRIYRVKQQGSGFEKPQLLTRDHCQGGRFLSRALGMDSHLEVDYQQQELQQGDVLMLTTDGVHNVLTAQALYELLDASPSGNLEQCAKSIVSAALDLGSKDNVSCLLCRLNELPIEGIDETHRKLTQQAIPPVLEIGMKLDGYRVLQTLHSGTRSHVYRVEHIATTQCYVIKAPSENFCEDPNYLRGFIHEQWIGQRLDHPQLMKIFPHDDSSPFLYHLCEYIPAQTLRQWMYDNPEPSLESVRNITASIISAVRVLQRMGMVHRDLKPENILIDENSQVKLIDFGTVRVDALEEIHLAIKEDCPVGSVDYIAPEYLMGEAGDHQADIFSVGVIVYEMLTSVLPFDVANSTYHQVKTFQHWKYKSACVRRADIPSWLNLSMAKATSPNPKNRYTSLSEFMHDLSTPNSSMLLLNKEKPLLESDPLRFWKSLSGVLLLIMIAQWIMLLA
ncbi:MAG: serine/threonine protein kinase [SAR86 cluster bacterium]|uniref:non-specific serine/threonine protein kinase n=1 Tax=SAR86 cluster bacterium TaxID=2030880 RepID=A0A2A4MHA1_9GAMM|nr:MAG: serine/threonine protein kinase [SAR86 cluster bacterium]